MVQPQRIPSEPQPFEPSSPAGEDLSPPPPPASSTLPLQFDWSSWYLTDEDDMGENPIHAQIIHDFVDLLLTVAEERGWHRDQVGSDAFFAWVPAHPLVRISPDLYLLEKQIEPLPASFQMWKQGQVPPSFALEVVSEDWRKDYDQNPKKYAQLGTKELVIFDPDAAGEWAGRGPRVPLQVYRRNSEGFLARVYAGTGPVWSEVLDLLLFIVNLGQGRDVRLRFAYDREGEIWVKSSAEAKAIAEQERRRAEQGRVHAEERRVHAEERRVHAERERARAEEGRAEAERERARVEAERNQALEERDRALKESAQVKQQNDLVQQALAKEAQARKAAEDRLQELLAELSKTQKQ